MARFLGLDCGGSTCRALVLDENGEAIFRGQSGAANLSTTPPAALRDHLKKALEGCPPVDAACAAFAGLLGSPERERALEILTSLGLPESIRLEPDFAATLAACPEGTDLCVLAGTGSLVCSRIRGGTLEKTGGLGALLGDDGSAFAIGRAALRDFLDAPHSSSEAARGAIEALCETLDPAEIVGKVYRAPSPAAFVAKLAASVGLRARNGEPDAFHLVETQMTALAELAAQHARRLGLEAKGLRIALAGGLWQGSAAFREAFLRALEARGKIEGASVEHLKRPPVEGAVKLAMETAYGN